MFIRKGAVCLICITFHNMLMNKEKIFENILSLSMSVYITLLWVMVNSVRQDIIEQGMSRRETNDFELKPAAKSNIDLHLQKITE